MPIVTLGDLKQAIVNDLNRDDLTDVVADYLEEVILEYQRKFFFATDLIFYLNTVPGQVFYDMPTELLSIDFLRLNLAGNWQWLRKQRYELVLSLDSLVVPSQSVPSLWAPFDNKFRIYQAPDQIYQLELTGHGKIPLPLLDTDTNFWTTTAAPMLRRATCAEIYRRRIKNPELAALNDSAAEKQRLALMRETVYKTTQRQIAAHW